MPAPVIAALIIAGGTAGGAAIAAHGNTSAAQTQADASKTATAAQANANQQQLDFTKQQASAAYNSQEADRKANYDQWAARQSFFGNMGTELGLPNRTLPAYVPTPPNPFGGVAPAGAPSQAPSPMGATAAPAPAATGAGTNYQSLFQNLTGGKPLNQAGLTALAPQLQQAGIKLGNPNATGVISKIILPDQTAVRVLDGDTSVASPTTWMVQPGTGPTSTAKSASVYQNNPSQFAMGTMGDMLMSPQNLDPRNTLTMPQLQYGTAPQQQYGGAMGAYL